MVDLLSVDTQELVEIIGRNAGVALLAPPSDAQEAQNALATVLSAISPKKQKVGTWAKLSLSTAQWVQCWSCHVWRRTQSHKKSCCV
jgi:hypothetical protein